MISESRNDNAYVNVEGYAIKLDNIIKEYIRPGDMVDEETADNIGNPDLLIVRKLPLTPTSFRLRQSDCISGIVPYPGISVTLDPVGLGRHKPVTWNAYARIASRAFGGGKSFYEIQPTEVIFVAPIRQVLGLHYFTLMSAPTRWNQAHFLLVYNEHIEQGVTFEVKPPPDQVPQLSEIVLEPLSRLWTPVSVAKEVGKALKKQTRQ